MLKQKNFKFKFIARIDEKYSSIIYCYKKFLILIQYLMESSDALVNILKDDYFHVTMKCFGDWWHFAKQKTDHAHKTFQFFSE